MPRSNMYKNINKSNTKSTSSMSTHLPTHSFDKNKTSNISNQTNPSFAQTLKEGFGFGMGSSAGQIMMYNLLGFPKVNVEHKYTNDNIMPCNTTKNCSEIFLEFEKCKGDWNCNHDKFDQLKNEHEKCQDKHQ
jgi:hypothetical protein